MKHSISELTSQALFDILKVADLGYNVILNDNFNYHITIQAPEAQMYKDCPLKLNSVMTIFLCLDGTFDIHHNLTRYHLTKNDALISQSGVISEFNGMSPDFKFALIIIDNSFYSPIFTTTNSTDIQKVLMTHPMCHLSDSEMDVNIRIYHLLKEKISLQDDYPYKTEIVKGLIQSLLFNVYSSLVSEVKTAGDKQILITRNQDIYFRFMEAVQQHYSQNRDIGFYADLLCLTPKYLSQIVYKASGSYASDHIRNFVIMEAKSLLKSRQHTVMEICDILNFNSQSFFSKYFKEATGYSPCEYRDK